MQQAAKHIVILSHYAGSSRHGMVWRNYLWAKAWAAQGHTVTVVAASYAHTRSAQPEVAGEVAEEIIDGIRYVWLKTTPYREAGSAARVLAMLQFSWACWQRVPLWLGACDVLVASSPHPFVIYPARKWARALGAKLVFDIRDLWPLTLVELGGIARLHPFIQLMQLAENYACKHADLITAVPAYSEPYLVRHGLREGRFLPVPNGVWLGEETAEQALPAEHAALLADLRARSAFIVGYSGAIGLANAMWVAVDALAKAPMHAHLVLVGHGNQIEVLRARAEALGVASRVHFLPNMPKACVPGFLKAVDAAYLGFADKPLYAMGVSPTKINDYMLAGLPVIYAVGGPENPISQSGGGIHCRPDDVAGVAEAMGRLAAMDGLEREAMGAKGQAWVRAHHDIAQHARAILQKLA